MERQLKKCLLRPMELTDAASIKKHINNPNVLQYMRNIIPYPYVEQDAINFITMMQENPEKGLVRAVEIDSEVVGAVGIHMFDDVYSRSAELGYWLSEDYWGRGIITEAVQVMANFAFEQFDIVRLQAEVYHPNTASMIVLKRSGFEFEGIRKKAIWKNHQLMDAHMYVRFGILD